MGPSPRAVSEALREGWVSTSWSLTVTFRKGWWWWSGPTLGSSCRAWRRPSWSLPSSSQCLFVAGGLPFEFWCSKDFRGRWSCSHHFCAPFRLRWAFGFYGPHLWLIFVGLHLDSWSCFAECGESPSAMAAQNFLALARDNSTAYFLP